MRGIRSAIAFSLLAAAALSCDGAVPSTVPSTKKADDSEALAAKSALREFRRLQDRAASSEGGLKLWLDAVYFPNEESRRTAEVIWGRTVVNQRLERTVEEEFFPREKAVSPPKLAEDVDDLADGMFSIGGDLAQFTILAPTLLNGRHVTVLIKDKGTWKVDFERTARPDRRPFNREALEHVASEVEFEKKLIADIKAHKFKSPAEMTEFRGKQLPEQRFAVERPRPSAAADVAAARADMARLRLLICLFDLDNGRYPTESEGLRALLRIPHDELMNTYRGPYADMVPNDPWGRLYVYAVTGKGTEVKATLTSSGPDQRLGTDDDLTLATE